MAEIIGLVSSLIGIIQITGQVVILAHGYIGGVKRASQDISSLIDELESLGKVLGALKDYVETKPKSSALLKLDGPNGPLRGLKWPLKEAETKEYVSQFERHKTLFILALEVDHITLSKEIEAYTQSTATFVQDIWIDSADQKAWRNKYDDIHIREKREKVLSWLSPDDFKRKTESRHTEVSETRQPGTGKWLLVTPEFEELVKKHPEHSLLWGFGIPGAGKTFLSSAVIDYFLEEAATKNYGIAYMYFEYMERELQTPINVLASLVRDLTAQIPILPMEVEKLHDACGAKGRRPKIEELYTALVATFKSFDRVFLVFDALDECDPKSQRRDLLPLFLRMGKSGASILVTSRQHPEDIQEYFCDVAKIELSPKEEDIGVYIRQRIDGDVRTRRLVRQAKCEDRIVSDLTETSQGMFLLAHFNIEYICKQPTAKKVLIALDKIKGSSTTDRPLDPTYDRAMETLRTQSEDCIDLGLLVLSWLVKANRTLTVEEIRVAISIEPDRYELDELDLPDRATILDMCAGLVIIDETSDTMKLAHYTVQEYLLKNSIIFEDSYFRLAMACTTFLTFDVFADGACTSDSSLKSRLKLQPFLEYAVHQLSHHLKLCDEDLTKNLVLKFLENSSNTVSYLQVLHCKEIKDFSVKALVKSRKHSDGFEKYPKDHSPLHLASSLNHITVFKLLLEQGADTTSRDSHGHTPLHIAAGKGSEEVVNLLLENGVNPNALDEDGETPLHDAARLGYLGVVRLLMAEGVELSIRAKNGQTPVFHATEAGNLEVVRLLLSGGADCSIPDNDGDTSLHMAIGNPSNYQFLPMSGLVILSPVNMDLVKLLVDNGARISARDNEGVTVLHYGALGPVPLVQYLIEKGADISAIDDDGETVLHMAALGTQRETMEFLLDNGASISARRKNGDTALHVAIQMHQDNMIDLLLERGIDIFIINDMQYSALHVAAEEGQITTAKKLLEKGVDVDFRSTESPQQTALHTAIFAGQEEVARFLIDNGADISLLTTGGRSAIHLAALSGSESVVRRILEKGIEISERTATGCTALHEASTAGACKVIRYLLECGADITDTDDKGWSALHYAAFNSQLDAVQLLIEKGADICALDKKGQTVLYRAAEKKSEVVVEFLLDNCTDISVQVIEVVLEDVRKIKGYDNIITLLELALQNRAGTI